jgi:TRAP transporter TAXI family solute receptor
MQKGLKVLGLGLGVLLAIAYSSASTATEMAIMTGSEKGTYYQFGLNLQQLVKSKGIELNVIPSTGSIENLYAVYQRPRTQIGIVQSDVLAFVSRLQSNPTLIKIAQKTKMVFPLYNEEIHLLGKRDIADFEQLAGKRVAVGEDGSGTYLTARLLFEVSGVKPKEMVTIGTTEALSQLKAGTIDAMFYVAGLPVKLFTEGVTEKDGLSLIPILSAKASEFYPKTKIPANTYKWQPEEVNTLAVKAVLVSFNFRAADCEYVGRLGQLLYENFNWLKENGHPKWKSVDLDYPLKGWEQYDCVKKYLVKIAQQSAPAQPKTTDQINPIMDAVKEMLGK